MSKVRKVRALVVDATGGVHLITGDAPHVLQLPGGTAKPGERWRQALRREVREETGFNRVRIITRTRTRRFHRNGVTEVTRCYLVRVSGKQRPPALTSREKARGLTVTRFPSRKAALRALTRRLDRYGRSAVRRDLALAKAILARG